MSSVDRQLTWRRALAGEPGDDLLVDIGTSTVTGVRALGAAELASSVRYVGHPVLQTLAFGAADTAALGSDTVRTGLVYEQPEIVEDTFRDPLGVEWLWADGAPAPLNHPLEHSDLAGIAGHPRPDWPRLVQVADPPAGSSAPLVVADAPCSGLLETAFGLRNSWQFMVDLTDNWRAANALLDWALATVSAGYEHLLSSLPEQPDIVIYGDDYGYQSGMFLSDVDFRTFVRPRLRTLFSRIRRLTPAAICFHCCGAVRPILSDLADLGVELLNLQYDAKDMIMPNIRRVLPRDLILHGYTDLFALGKALQDGDRKGVAVLATEIAQSIPAIIAPMDSLASDTELLTAARGAAFVHALTPDDIDQLRRFGPVRGVLEAAAERSARAVDPVLTGNAPTVRPAQANGRAGAQLVR